MNKLLVYGTVGLVAMAAIAMVMAATAYAASTGLTGYHKNDIFVGTGYQWCSQKLGWSASACYNYMGSSASDILVMKWNAQWDNCNAHGNNDAQYCLGAWLDNEWNGMVPGGDGGVWHYKIIWVGSQGESSPYWISGGELVWNNYEIIMDQGTSAGVHSMLAHTTPNGYA